MCYECDSVKGVSAAGRELSSFWHQSQGGIACTEAGQMEAQTFVKHKATIELECISSLTDELMTDRSSAMNGLTACSKNADKRRLHIFPPLGFGALRS